MAHSGVAATTRLLTARYLWPGMRRDIRQWAQACLQCQKSKINKHNMPEIEKIPIPVRRFSHLHLDLVGPMSSSRGYRYLLTIVDRASRYPHAVPIEDATTESVWKAFMSTWISHFGFPTEITTDRGTNFCSSKWLELCEISGIKTNFTTAYHPASNGLVERFHRTLKASLRAHGAEEDWVDVLPIVLLALRVTPRP